MANQNEAYDFSLFEPSRKEQEQQRPAPSKQPKKKNNLIRISEEQLEKSRRIKYKPTTVIGGILFSLIVLTIMGTMILSQVQLTELTENINDANALLAEQQSITTQLQVKVESQLSLRSVEDYARTSWGCRTPPTTQSRISVWRTAIRRKSSSRRRKAGWIPLRTRFPACCHNRISLA